MGIRIHRKTAEERLLICFMVSTGTRYRSGAALRDWI